MSRSYEMIVSVGDVKVEQNEVSKIENVMTDVWCLDSARWEDFKHLRFKMSGQGCLNGGKSESEFVDEISKAIWIALGRYVPVQIDCIYLDDPPMNTFNQCETDYVRLILPPKHFPL